MELTFTLTPDQAARAATIACRDAGHDTTDCPNPATCTQQYAEMMLSKHVEMSERQAAEEAARQTVVPFFEPPA